MSPVSFSARSLARWGALLAAASVPALGLNACSSDEDGSETPSGEGGAPLDGDGGDDGGTRGGRGGMGGEAPTDRGGSSSSGEGTVGGRSDPTALGFCDSDKDCKSGGQVCEIERQVCVECLADADCGNDALCLDGSCQRFTTCQSSLNCPVDEVCDEERSFCVECVRDNDCDDEEVCRESECRVTCDSDKDCRSFGQLCLLEEGFCVECTADVVCADGEFCSDNNVCLPQICPPGASYCEGDLLLTCGSDGTSFQSFECADGCVRERDEALCEGSKGGKRRSGWTDLCSTIPRFRGVQTVDADASDFAGLPSYPVTFENSEYQNVWSPEQDTTGSSAHVQLAWDEDGLHAFVTVFDPNVRHTGGQLYDGDNVQFFFSGAAPTEAVLGPSTNGGSWQIFVQPETSDRSERTETYPSAVSNDYEYQTASVDGGYAVELSFPWPDGTPDPGDRIGFNLQIGVLDGEGGIDFEYGMKLTEIEGAACDALWCDARRWCQPSLQ